ncbi:MAG: hypothetical protein GXO45_00250, partial [Aquificae bacterium]|nr:hypothetical protein [Aquificota bacterium]
MYKKFFPLFFALLVFTQVFAQDIEFKPLKKVFNKGEKVCFVLVNNSDAVIYLPNSAPWVVFEKEKPENIVYSPVALQVITTLKKGDKKQWCWE